MRDKAVVVILTRYIGKESKRSRTAGKSRSPCSSLNVRAVGYTSAFAVNSIHLLWRGIKPSDCAIGYLTPLRRLRVCAIPVIARNRVGQP